MSSQLSDWLINHYGQEQMRPGLDRIREALFHLLPSFKNTRIIIIAGTNGKGETTLRLSEALKNHRHFTWTSPHILRLTERMRNERGEIAEEILEEVVKECHERVSSKGFQLSYYEFLFFVFCTWASRQNPEFLLLEVGLGGRLDAVNVFDAELILLPSISRDHQEILGGRLDKILAEKLGTLRKGSTLIHFLESEYLCEKASESGELVGAKVISLKENATIPGYEFSLRNAALASAAYKHLTGHNLAINEFDSLEHRGEVLRGKNEFIFYGSHNIDGLRKLIQFLHSGTYTFSRPPYDGVIVAFSKRSVDDLKVMLKMIRKSELGKVTVTVFDHPKAADARTMEVLCFEEGLDFVQDIETYKEVFQGSRVLVTGSYYFLGHFKSVLCR